MYEAVSYISVDIQLQKVTWTFLTGASLSCVHV